MRPNILCIVSEDCPPRLGAYGDRLARTPNLDGLAASGVSFDAAPCTSPVSAPSRFSILTDRYPESAPPAQQMTAWGPMPRDGHAEGAVRRLTSLADDDQALWIRLKAITALTDLPLFPEISRPVIAYGADEPGQYIRGSAGYLLLKLDGTYRPDSKVFRYDLFLQHMEGHSGIGPQSFPDLETLRAARAS